MSRASYAGPKLPGIILDQIQHGNSSKAKGRETSRKDQRKAQRQTTKIKPTRHDKSSTTRSSKPHSNPVPNARGSSTSSKHNSNRTVNGAPIKSILKKPTQQISRPETDSDDDDAVDDDDEDEDDEEEDDIEDAAPVVSRAVKTRLTEDDAEIAALEKKLGIKGKPSKTQDEDGLDWLVAGSGSESDEDSFKPTKRKRSEDDRWLRDKRLKASNRASNNVTDVGKSVDEETGIDDESDEFGFDDDVEEDFDESVDTDDNTEGLENPFSDDEIDSDDFGDSDGSIEQKPKRPRVRENPYVPPVSKAAVTTGKYIPPSLRKVALSQDEDLGQLKRQIQGQLNRLSEANFLSILQAIEGIYRQNARQSVSTALTDLLLGLVSDVSILNETFLILHAGFATAVYRVVGTDFGALLLEKVIEAIERSRAPDAGESKQCLNLIAFISNLYALQMIGSTIVFDFIRDFLHDLTENKTEMLLRIIRTSGIQLRQDDPTSLKDIVLLLMRSVSEIGEENLSVRTKFMIETINNLKDNRMKSGAAASSIAADHLARIRKSLGTLNTRTIRSSEPLQISLADIKESDKKGKWWLVGASYRDPAKHLDSSKSAAQTSMPNDVDDGYESETPGHVSLQKLAKSQGMNTEVRRAIFVAILSASDCQDAHQRLEKLRLKSKQDVEIPKVLLHCVGAEKVYNPYYTLIAKKLCGERKIQKTFQFALWDLLKRLEGQEDVVDEDDGMKTTTIVNLARLYGTLIADGTMPITVLKVLDFAFLQPQTQIFTEVLFTTIMLRLHHKGSKKSELAIPSVFNQAASASQMIPGLRLYLKAVVAKAGIANGATERKAVRKGCDIAEVTLSTAKVETAVMDDDTDSDGTD